MLKVNYPSKKIVAFYQEQERKIIPAMLVAGFVFDLITFRNIDIFFTFFLLVIHLIIAAGAIGFINIFDQRLARKMNKCLGYGRLLSPLAMQFSFGALLSAAFIFYSFGGAWSISWPLIVAILFLMLSNEFFKRSYLRLTVQCGVYFFVLFTTLSIFLPFAFQSLRVWVFLLAGVMSVGIMTGLVYALTLVLPMWRVKWRQLGVIVGFIFLFLNSLYFLNIVPPIPVSLRDAGVYHSVTRVNGEYMLDREVERWWEKIVPGKTIHITSGGRVFVFTSIFAPAEIRTNVVHDWQHYDEEEGRWKSVRKLSFGISGGREDGYRGFSVRSSVEPGRWRVFVETERGQVLGRVNFQAVRVEDIRLLESLTT